MHVRSILLALAVLVALNTSRATAAMMVHFDLAGLLLQADSVVIADRVVNGAQGETRGQYRVVRSLRGGRKAGDVVEVDDGIYATDGRSIEKRAVLFLRTYNGNAQLVASGLRVIETGKVWRFQQQDNPGPFRMVPQGHDPQDQWGLGGAQLDLAGLERAIAEAQKRVDALAAAKSIADTTKRRAVVVSLFAPGAHATGFYVDLLAERARTQLVDAGDLEGALLVDLRDRGISWRSRDFAKVGDLISFAKDGKRAVEARTAAIAVAGRGFSFTEDFASIKAVAALIEDPDPAIRAAAVVTAARPAGVISSDNALQRKINAAVVEIRAVIAKRYAIEQDQRVLVAMLAVYQNSFRKKPPTRASGPRIVAAPSITDYYLVADVYCTRPTRITDSRITLQSATGPVSPGPVNIQVHCDDSTSTGGGPNGTAPPPGTYQVGVELTLKDGSKVALSLGRLFVDTSGERHLVP